jgi:putative serine protease PepD
MIRRSTATLVAVLALLSGLILGAVGAREYFGLDVVAAPVTPTGSSVTVRAPDSVAGIAQAVVPSTVYIEAATATGAASGTGLILRADGYIVTNNHVIASGGTIQVTFSDGTVEVAEVVGTTSDYDLAVLKVERTGLDPLPLADSDLVMVGDPVVAVGAPLGLEGTVTSGIVSALNRAVTAGSVSETSFINAIQTDAAINPGNSGGPLVNAAGEVIGINTAIAQASGTGAATGSIGLGFAIPSNQVRRTTDQLIETGRATYPIIGILLDGRQSGEGVMVATAPSDGNEPVTPGGPGDDAGIRPGDIILSIDGRPMTSPDEVIVYVRSRAPGDTLTLTIRRGGREEDVDVVLGEQEAN